MEKNELRKQTKTALLSLAKGRGLKGVSRLRKADLLARLMETGPVKPPPAPRSPIAGQESTAHDGFPSFHTPARPDRSGQEESALDQSGPLAPQPLNEVQRDAMDSKFFLGPEDKSLPPPSPELPSAYNDNRLVLLARDPYWLYAYWDFSVEQISTAYARLNAQDARPILRVFDVTYVDFDGTNAWNSIDLELAPFATNWYVQVPRPNAAYCVEMGYRAPDGRFSPLGRSNIVTTPRAEVSPVTTPSWLTPPKRHPFPVPSPQSRPLPLSAVSRAQGSWPLGPAGREALPPLPAPSSAQHPFSWSLGGKAGTTDPRRGNPTR